MKPSELLFASLRLCSVPFADTLGKCEMEQAAALLALCCKKNGDEWKQHEREDILLSFEHAVGREELPWKHLKGLPVFRPDLGFPIMHEKGFASYGAIGRDEYYGMTERGLFLLHNPGQWRSRP